FFDAGTIGIPRRRRRSQQYQDRYLQAQRFTEHLSPFPITVLYPQLIACLEKQIPFPTSTYTHIIVLLSGTDKHIVAQHTSTNDPHIQTSIIPVTPLTEARSRFDEVFGPLNHINGFCPSKLYEEFSHAFMALFN